LKLGLRRFCVFELHNLIHDEVNRFFTTSGSSRDFIWRKGEGGGRDRCSVSHHEVGSDIGNHLSNHSRVQYFIISRVIIGFFFLKKCLKGSHPCMSLLSSSKKNGVHSHRPESNYEEGIIFDKKQESQTQIGGDAFSGGLPPFQMESWTRPCMEVILG